MIFAKTDMKNIPKSCKHCVMSITEIDTTGNYYKICGIKRRVCPKRKNKRGNEKYILPDWCPLVSNYTLENLTKPQ